MATGFFDDLPTVASRGKATGGGLFDDIGTDPLVGIQWDSLADPKQAKATIDKLPEGARQRARDMWADTVVARERTGGGIGQRVDDAMRRFSSSVPGIGTWADELNAATSALFGGDYEMAHAYERAKDRAVNRTETTKLATLPVVGDVTTGGLEKAAGTIMGAFALPMGRVVEGGSAAATAANVGLNAGAYGAVQGAGEGTTLEERAKNAATSGAISAAGGAALGGVLGKITGKGTPDAIADLQASNATAQAAQKIGVDLPNVAAGTPNSAKMVVGATLKEIPVVGAPIHKAADKAVDQMGAAAQRIAGQYSANATQETAGEVARRGIADWIKTGSAKTLNEIYEGIGKMVPETATRPLSATREAVKRLKAEDFAAASSTNKRAIDMVAEAIERPAGLSYKGLLQLRTNVGNMLDDGLLPEAGTVKPALKRVYAALTDDLSETVRAFGGRAAQEAWRKGNNAARIIENRREMLGKVVGLEGEVASEKVLDRIIAMAGTKSTANAKTLLQAKKVMPREAWDEIASAAIARLGNNQGAEFSLPIFLKNYNALSTNGRNILFASTEKAALKTELDALAKTIESFRNLQRLGNSSGTGRVVVGALALTGSSLNPAALPFVLMKGIAGRVMAQALAKPVAVREINRTAKRLYDVLESGKGQVALRFATLTLAKKLADVTGEDEREIASSLEASRNVMLAGPMPPPEAPEQAPQTTPPQSPGPTMRAYEPTLRDRIASALMPDDPRSSPVQARLVEGLVGSRGLGRSGPGGMGGLVDFVPPAGVLFAGDEASRAAQRGDVTGAALNALGVVGPGGQLAARAVAPAIERAAAEAVPQTVAGREAAQVAVGAAKEAPAATGLPVGAAPIATTETDAVRIVTPDSAMEIAARPQIVELDTLKSAQGKFQPRDRSRAEYVQEARERASRLDPAQLGVSRVSDSGAPIVLDDGTIISGNGRTMSIEEAYSNPALAAQAEAYKASLGPEAAGMRQPVLVMRAEGLSGDDAVKFADLSNRGRIAQMSATERAQRDATALGDGILLYQGGDFEAPQNAEFLRAFMEKAATRTERAALSKDGFLTQEGAQRLRNAVLAAAYDDAPTLSRMLESTDDNIRSITGALTDAAPKFAGLRADIRAGVVMPEMDATKQITDAVKLIADLRSRRVRPADFFAQKDAFGGTDPIVESWVRAFYNDDLARPISREKMTAVLNAYADEAVKHRPGGLFPDETTAKDVLNVAQKARFAEPEPVQSGPSLFDAARGNGASVPEGGAAVSGREAALGSAGPDGPAPERTLGRGLRDITAASKGKSGLVDRVAGQSGKIEAQRAARKSATDAYKAATGTAPPKEWPISRILKELEKVGA